MIYLGIPTMDGHEWTQRMVANLAETVMGEAFHIIVVDDNSEVPYTREEFPQARLPMTIIRNEKNEGFYYPLRKIAVLGGPDDIVAIMHNDLIFYEKGWNLRLEQAFRDDTHVGLVGTCGSYEVDLVGGRGGGTMVWFKGLAQSQSAGERISTLRPAVVLDSMFMAFRNRAVPHLRIEEDIPTPAHFYDKIWPLRLIEKGWRVAVLGTEIDHWGGITCVANPRFQEVCRQWLAERGLPERANGDPYWGNWNFIVYREAERRLLAEFGVRMMPLSVSLDYTLRRASATAGFAPPWRPG